MKIDTTLSTMLLEQTQNVAVTPALRPTQPPATPPQLDPAFALEKVSREDPKDIVEIRGVEIDVEHFGEEEFDDIDVRFMTPRQMVDMSMDLYIEGSLSFEEYSLLASQSELHPRYENTIGALTGEKAEPDEPRDFIREWEERLDFEERYPSDDEKSLQQIERILNVLGAMDQIEETIN